MSVKRVRALLGGALVICALCACKEQPETPPVEANEPQVEAESYPEVVPVPEAVPDEVAPPSAAQLPVPEDFQVETARVIVRANYLSELDKLEGEMRADED